MKGHTYFQGENIAEEQKYMDKKNGKMDSTSLGFFNWKGNDSLIDKKISTTFKSI